MKHLHSWWLVLLPLAGACGDLTEVMLVVGTDLEVPAELDDVVVEVETPETEEAARQMRPSADAGPPPLPFPLTLGLVPKDGFDALARVRVQGLRAGRTVVERSAAVRFTQGKTRMVRLDLCRACLDAACAEGETCIDGTCTPIPAPVPTAAWPGAEEARASAPCR